MDDLPEHPESSAEEAKARCRTVSNAATRSSGSAGPDPR